MEIPPIMHESYYLQQDRYHCWRMVGTGAELVLGIDPTPLFVFQYWAVQKYLQDPRVWVVPQRLGELPAQLNAFDSVFSMGILYHRRSPLDHLLELREALRPGGQLVLETLVIEGGRVMRWCRKGAIRSWVTCGLFQAAQRCVHGCAK